MTVYLLIAGTFFLLFYVLLRKPMFRRKIQQYFPKNKEYRREIKYSLLSLLIFIVVQMLVFKLPVFSSHSAYAQWGAHFQSWLYIPVFYLAMLLLHDAYFYWTHRLMHQRQLFRWFHRVHHRSVSPSPWASFSFGPLEAAVQVGIVPVFSLIIPLHTWHIDIFFVFSLLYNAYGHLGFELYPRRFNQHWLGKWINTAVHHDLHHQQGASSYGLYLTFWDRMMGTMNKEYDQRFDIVTCPAHLDTVVKPRYDAKKSSPGRPGISVLQSVPRRC